MLETESLCAENIGLKDIARSQYGTNFSRVFYYRYHLRMHKILKGKQIIAAGKMR